MMHMFSGGRRRNGSTSYRYPANDSMAFDSIPEVPGEESSGTRRNLTTASSSRPTLAWPFQSRSISHSLSHSLSSFRLHSAHPSQSQSQSQSQSASSQARRSSGWVNLRPASSVLGSDIIPDYVVNFIRGETPETLARRREMEGNPRQAELRDNSRMEQSWAADFSPRSRSGSRILDLGAMAAGFDDDAAKRPLLMRLVTGWRGGVALNVLLAAVILVAMVVCIVLAATTGKFGAGDRIISTGSCGRIRGIDQAVQVIGNVLGVFFIAGASYVTQVLVSPTRDEVDAAHRKHRWLDIGVPSLRNMTAISVDRAILSAALVSAAVASQVIYNALVFHTLTDGSDTCSLALNGPLLGAVVVLGLLFILACIISLVRPPLTDQLVTLGDAVASFLITPDATTEGACMLAKDDVSSGRWAAGEVHSRYWFPEPHRWGQTPSLFRWIVYCVSWLLPAGMAAAMLSMAVIDGKGDTAAAFSSLARRPNLTYDLPSGVPRLGLSVVIALPQLLLILLYFSTNSLLSVLYLSHEFSQFAGEPSPLRLSTCRPIGSQTTSLYLTLPRPVSWILYILFVAMGFMLNQAFNIVSVDGSRSDSALGVNPLPLVIILGLLVLILILLLGLSLRRGSFVTTEDGRTIGHPLNLKGGSCSAVISARCHRSPREGEDIAAYPLVWGAVTEDSAPASETKIGHATFSSRPVDPLKVGKAYA